jgi:hypothetical protein
MNSWPATYFFHNISPKVRGGYMRFKALYMSQIPIPPTSPDEQHWCEMLAETLIWLQSLDAKNVNDKFHGLMMAYFEQWLNGLVYELYFPGELHDRKLKIFNETAKLNPPDFMKDPDARKLTMVQDVFNKAYDVNATLRSMLFDLRSLDVVRVIEQGSNESKEDR